MQPSRRLAPLRRSLRRQLRRSPSSSARSSSNDSRSPTKMERFSVMLLTGDCGLGLKCPRQLHRTGRACPAS
eukprot:6042714-Prymnesium_polylepis.1